MVIDNAFETAISDTEKALGVMLKKDKSSATMYVLNYNCDINASEEDAKSGLQAEINKFVPDNPPQLT